jgi:hypothetical protein
MLESGFRGLPVSRFQYQHGVLSYRHSRSVAVGQTLDDGSSAHLVCDRSSAGSAGCKHSLGPSMTEQQSETTRLIEDQDS